MNIDAIERLARLKESGALTQEEFDAEKAKILSESDSGDAQQMGTKPAYKAPAIAAVVVVLLAGALYLMPSGPPEAINPGEAAEPNNSEQTQAPAAARSAGNVRDELAEVAPAAPASASPPEKAGQEAHLVTSASPADDTCKARVTKRVSAIQDPSSSMDAGETWTDVTQFWRDESSGKTWFCAHGDYCYPSHVTAGGKHVEAIKLLNCSVREEVSRDGSEVLYGVW